MEAALIATLEAEGWLYRKVLSPEEIGLLMKRTMTMQEPTHTFQKDGDFILLHVFVYPGLWGAKIHAIFSQDRVIAFPSGLSRFVFMLLLQGESIIACGNRVVNLKQAYGMVGGAVGTGIRVEVPAAMTEAFIFALRPEWRRLLSPLLPVGHPIVEGTVAPVCLVIGKINRALRRLVLQWEKQVLPMPDQQFHMESRCLELLVLASAQLRESCSPKPATTIELNKQVFDTYIQERLEERILLRQMAGDFHMSLSALKNRFARLFGVSIHQYVLGERLLRSRHLLDDTEASIYEVSLRSGFSDPSHFTKRFKKWLGMTPKAYRKQGKNKQ